MFVCYIMLPQHMNPSMGLQLLCVVIKYTQKITFLHSITVIDFSGGHFNVILPKSLLWLPIYLNKNSLKKWKKRLFYK